MISEYMKRRMAIKNGIKVLPEKRPKAIPKVSPKQAQVTKEYGKLRKQFLSQPENKFCQAKAKCNGKRRATDVHHLEGRSGKKMLDAKTWMAVCRDCHRHIHDNDGESLEKGLKRSRITKPEK